MEIDSEYADPAHPMGVSEDGYNAICDRLADLGTNIDVLQAD